MGFLIMYEESYKDQVLQKYSYKAYFSIKLVKKNTKNWQSNFSTLQVWLFCQFIEVQV